MHHAGMQRTRAAGLEKSERSAATDNFSQKDLERWASAVAGCLVQPVAPTAPSGLLGGTPEAWRPSVGALTPGSSDAAIPPDLAGETAANTAGDGKVRPDGPGSDRLQVRLDAGHLGEIAVVVEKDQGGVRLLITAKNAQAVRAISAERQALQQALQSTGQPVQSLCVVQMDVPGTDLAELRSSPGRSARADSDEDLSKSPSRKRKGKSGRLDITG